MPRHITIFFIITCNLLAACSLLSDKKHILEEYSKLTVVVDNSSNFYLDEVLVKNNSGIFRLSKDYDTTRETIVYLYDSLKNNEYEITLASLLNRDVKIPLTLIKDTVVFVGKSQLKNF